MKKAIGGYFGLELKKGKEYHNSAKKLNTARNAIELILRFKKYKKILLPGYICDSVLEPIEKLGLNYVFYSIDKSLLPLVTNNDKDTCIIIVNYFGLLEKEIANFVKVNENVIVDNSQAFFSKPIDGIDSVYSPRKFFGVPDGAYLYTNCSMDVEFQQDISYTHCDFLLKRIDVSPEVGYSSFQVNEERLNNNPIRKMSKLTQALLSSIDYEFVRKRRNENFFFLHENLKDKNELTELIESEVIDGPMVYPFMTKDTSLRKGLLNNRIYVATYWNDVFERANENSFEWQLAKDMIPLPIDQRYEHSKMLEILKIIENLF